MGLLQLVCLNLHKTQGVKRTCCGVIGRTGRQFLGTEQWLPEASTVRPVTSKWWLELRNGFESPILTLYRLNLHKKRLVNVPKCQSHPSLTQNGRNHLATVCWMGTHDPRPSWRQFVKAFLDFIQRCVHKGEAVCRPIKKQLYHYHRNKSEIICSLVTQWVWGGSANE